jgi:hypothetical protein
MTTWVRAACHSCRGEVEIYIGDVVLSLDPDGVNLWRFQCPSCGEFSCNPIRSERLLWLLMNCGASVVEDPITEAEIVRFAMELSS